MIYAFYLMDYFPLAISIDFIGFLINFDPDKNYPIFYPLFMLLSIPFIFSLYKHFESKIFGMVTF